MRICCGTVGCSTALQARRLWVPFPMGSLAFFIMATMALGLTHPLTDMSTGSKGGQCVGLGYLEILGASTS